MPTVGVTGHVAVSDDASGWITTALTSRLEDFVASGWHGITCLARGADQIFAHVLLDLKAQYDVVLPAADYAQRMIDGQGGELFVELCAAANQVLTMPYRISSREAYLAASEAMLSRCDLLLAVWNGKPSQLMGDTADVVEKAKARSIPIVVLWPPSAT